LTQVTPNGKLTAAMRVLLTVALTAALAACGQDEVGREPRADAGFDQLVRAGSVVSLDGSASRDPHDAPLSYAWTLLEKPVESTAVLGEATSPRPTLLADAVGAYLFSLVVDNGERTSAPDAVVVRARNSAPVAIAQCGSGSSCAVTHGRTGTLDGRGSYDPDGDDMTTTWSQLTDAADCVANCPTLPSCAPNSTVVPLTSASSPLATFVAPEAAPLSLVFLLTVDDGNADAAACLVYTVANVAPVALLATSAGGTNPSSVNEGASFVLSGSPSGDPDGDGLTFLWEQLAGPAASLQSPNASVTSVTAPLIAANPGVTPSVILSFRLTVSDGLVQATAPISVVVNNL
jgi:hypothetical protein